MDESVLKQATLAIEILRQISTDTNILDDSLSQVKDAVNSIVDVLKQLSNDMEREQFGQQLTTGHVASMFTNIMKVLQKNCTAQNWPCIATLRTACIALSAQFESFCSDLYTAGCITMLLKQLELSGRVHSINDVEEYLIVTALCVLENCSVSTSENCGRILDLFWQNKAHKTLLRYTLFPHLQISIPAVIILGMLNLHIDNGVIEISKEVASSYLHKIATAIKECNSTVSLGYISVSLLELLKGANGLALNDKTSKAFIENNMLLSLLKLLKESENDDDKLEILDLLWTLATLPTIRELLCTNSEVLEELRPLSDAIPAAKYTLQKIESGNPIKDISNTVDYIQYTYQRRRHNECVRISESVLEIVDTDGSQSEYSDRDILIIKLILGKSLYYVHKNTSKFSPADKEVSAPSHRKKKLLPNIKKVILTLGLLLDENAIDEEGSKVLDLAMIEYIRITNNLNACKRCLLCRSKSQLKSSHVIPFFILAGYAKGMRASSSKKVYSSFDSTGEYEEFTSRQAAWWMLCGKCEGILSGGESYFAKEIFHVMYKTSDVSNPTKEVKIVYSKWLYQFMAGLAFRALAINTKGIEGFLNDTSLYKIFVDLRKFLLSAGNVFVDHPQLAIFVNPLSVSPTDSAISSICINRMLNLPGFMALLENDEKLNFRRIPRIANFLLVHIGIVNVVATIPGGNFTLPECSLINPQSGVFIIPPESVRFEKLPSAVWESLVLTAQMIESLDIQITQQRLQACNLSELQSSATLEEVFGITQAVTSDKEFVKSHGFQPSPDPNFPKIFDFLPQNIKLKRANLNGLILPEGHRFLLHQTLASKIDKQGEVTYFLCVGNDEDINGDYPKNKPYIVWHRFMPGLHINYGFFISCVDCSPESMLPDKHSKVYAEHLFADLKSSGTFEKMLPAFLRRVGTNLPDLIESHLNEFQINVKCVPLCWFCADKCDVCFSYANHEIVRYKKKFLYCSDSCKAKLVKSPPASSALPEGFVIRNEMEGSRFVTVPTAHVIVIHNTTEFNNQHCSGDLTIFFCKSGVDFDHRPYVLCHFHSMDEQFSIGMFISPSNFHLMELLPGSSHHTLYTDYVDSLYSSNIVAALLLKKARHNISQIFHSDNREVLDKRCEVPCWYCQDKCTRCFLPTKLGEFCSNTCKEKRKPHPIIFTSLPDGLTVKRAFDQSERSSVILPEDHCHLLHTNGSSCTPEGQMVSDLTMILCLEESTGKVYVVFQDYKPQRNRLANIAFYISTDDLSIGNLLCKGDVPGEIFLSQLKSQLYNIPSGIKSALERRGFTDMNSFLQNARTKRMDIKCVPSCWFCEHCCCVCLQPADITTSINGENILHCSESCLQVLYRNPGIIHLLPSDFKLVNNPTSVGSSVALPSGHRAIFHVCRDYKRKSGRFGQYLLIVCINSAKAPYILYHQFNSLRQISFGFYISPDSFEPKEPLQCNNKNDQIKCLNYMQQIMTLEPIGDIIKSALADHGLASLQPDALNLVKLKDSTCLPPCWYCNVKNQQ